MTENINLSKEQFELLRKKELELLKCFISVCDTLGLRYFVVEGTLLGAVRHGGFIPWDDDIDVGMPRSDYERFLSEAEALLPEKYFLQSRKTEEEYLHCFAKLRNKKTVFRETASKNLNINHGIYIDIFPFDYYPDSRVKAVLLDLNKLLVKYRVRERYYLPEDKKLTPANFARRLLVFASRLRFHSVEAALNYQDKRLPCKTKTNRLINHGSPWNNRERFPAEWASELTQLQFEGITVNVMKGYDRYLSNLYGDYHKLPPKEQQVPHHYLCEISFEGEE